MNRDARRHAIRSGLLAVAAALAPAPAPAPAQRLPPPEPPTKLEVLGKARAASAAKTYDLAWLYYSENRIDAGDVYGYSRLQFAAEQDVATTKAARVEAARNHLDRMSRLWTKVARVKKLGFSNTLDVNEAEYYHKEAQYWVAREEAWEAR